MFVLLFIDRLIVTLDMSVVMEDLGGQKNKWLPLAVASPVRRVIKHDQYCPLPLHSFAYSSLSPGVSIVAG